MLQESSKPEKQVEEWRKWTPERTRKFKRTMREKKKMKRAKRLKVREEKSLEKRKVPLYMYTLAKQVRNGAVEYLHSGECEEDFAVAALMLARKVMAGGE